MEIRKIEVPHYVNYISEWNELDMDLFKGHIIMDKTITGCGFTEYFLTNTQNVILCSPRKILLENKSDQHQDEVFYVKNETEKSLGIDRDLPKPTPGGIKKEEMEEFFHQDTPEEIEEKRKHILQLKQNLSDYIDNCRISCKPFKILVTYDSIKHVLEVLRTKFPPQIINNFQFVVDEFQSIFTDSKFKGNVEMDFVDTLQTCTNVCYLSATPMIEKYLDRIPEFAHLLYYKLMWGEDKVVKAKIIRKRVKSIIEEAGNIIDLYRKGTYPRKILEDKSIHESKEVVFYVNSVKTICSIVRKYNLKPEETNIICSKDDRNKKKLKSVGHQFGSIPLNPKDNKMFTFCTRTVYLGADFYSTSAYTVVFSDCSIESLSVDISLDLPQILGRQRLSSNVFRNECLLFYKIQKKPITWETFQKYLEDKREMTRSYLGTYDSCDDKAKIALMSKVKQGLFFKYSLDYLGLKSSNNTLAFNSLVELSEERAWEVSQVDYQDDITVKRILSKSYDVVDLKSSEDDIIKEYTLFEESFNKEPVFEHKMKLYCDFLNLFHSTLKTTNLPCIPREYQNYVNLLGTKKIRSVGYRKVDLENLINGVLLTDQIMSGVLHNFEVGYRYTLSEVKEKLQGIYNSLKIKKKAKATDLGEYFEIKSFVTTISGKAVRCIELIKLNSNVISDTSTE